MNIPEEIERVLAAKMVLGLPGAALLGGWEQARNSVLLKLVCKIVP